MQLMSGVGLEERLEESVNHRGRNVNAETGEHFLGCTHKLTDKLLV